MMNAAVYIDASNLVSAARATEIKIDYNRLYIWLRDHFRTDAIYWFVGYIKERQVEYSALQAIGFKIIFKKTLRTKGGIKGNCDAELVLKAAEDVIRTQPQHIVLVSSDGDFACLLEFALKEGCRVSVISPSHKLSYLVRRLKDVRVTFLKSIRSHIESEKAPDGDETP